MANMFAKAQVVDKVETKAKKKDDKREVQTPGVHDLAVVSALIKNLKAVEATLQADVKSLMRTEFTAEGNRTKKRPDSYRGVDGDSKATLMLSKRSTASPLTDEEVEAFTADKVPFEKVVAVEERFIVNPKYFADQELLEKASKALTKAGIAEDFVMLQAEQSKYIVSEDTVDFVFANGLIEKYLGMTTTLGIKPNTSVTDIKKSLDSVKKLLG